MADGSPALLRASGIAKRFGGVVALDGAEFDLRAGEVHALVGSNGCGKSTLAKIIAGAVGADGGSVLLEDRPVAFAGPAEAASEGIVTFYQELSLIPQMTVAENIFLGREPLTAVGLVDRRALRQAAGAAIAEFAEALSAGVDPDDLVAELSADERQIVEILKVLGLRVAHRHFRRGDRRPRPQPGRRAVPPCARPQGAGPRHRIHFPSAGRGSRDRRPGHGHAQWLDRADPELQRS